MTTTVTKIIGTGGDYSTIALWEDATDDTSLVAADEVRVGAIKNEVFSVAGNVVTFAGATTDATRYRHLTTDTGASFRDNASVQSNALRYNESNGAAIKCTSAFFTAIIIGENNVHLSKLQVANTSTGSTGAAIDTDGTVRTGCDIDGCIFEAASADIAPCFPSGAYSGKARNSVFAGRNSSHPALFQHAFNTVDFYNCTFVVPSDKTAATVVFKGSSGTVTCTNCAFFGVAALSSGTSSYSYTTCLTDATGTTGVTGGKTYANQFQNTVDATRDFRLKSGADCIDAGTTDSTNAGTDIAGTARPSGSSYDVGAWEFVAGGGGGGSTGTGTLGLLGVGS